jgi:transposase
MPPRPISEDLCNVLVHMSYKRDLSAKEIETITSVKLRTIQEILKRFRETGTAAKPQAQITRKGKLDDDQLEVCTDVSRSSKLHFAWVQYLNMCLQHSPDAYLDELQEQLQDLHGVSVDISTVWRALAKRGFTLKKVWHTQSYSSLAHARNTTKITKTAMERNEATRLAYSYRMGLRYEPNQLVFVDESSFDRRASYRGFAYALKGQRALRKCFFLRGKRYGNVSPPC